MLIFLVFLMISFTMIVLGIVQVIGGAEITALTLTFLSVGIFGLISSTLLWALRPKVLTTWPSCLQRIRICNLLGSQYIKGKKVEVLDHDKAEMVMKSIRGIPYLIQVRILVNVLQIKQIFVIPPSHPG